MATMVTEVFDALRSIGVAEDKAAKAAEAMASLEPEFVAVRSEIQQGFARVNQEFAAVRAETQLGFAKVNQEFAAVRAETQLGFAKVNQEFADVRSDIRLLKWQVGLLFAVTGPTLLLLLRVAVRVGAF